MSSEIKANTISEVTSANGVVVDGVTIKDGQVPASAGGSLVLLKSGTPSGADTGTTFDDFYSSDYDVYLVIANTLRSTADNEDVHMQLINTAGAVLSGADYSWIQYGRHDGGSTSGYQGDSDTNFGIADDMGSSGGESLSFTLWFSGFSNTGADVTYNGTMTYGNYNNVMISNVIGGRYEVEATTIRGLKFFCSGTGGFTGTGTIQVYGVKK